MPIDFRSTFQWRRITRDLCQVRTLKRWFRPLLLVLGLAHGSQTHSGDFKFLLQLENVRLLLHLANLDFCEGETVQLGSRISFNSLLLDLSLSRQSQSAGGLRNGTGCDFKAARVISSAIIRDLAAYLC